MNKFIIGCLFVLSYSAMGSSDIEAFNDSSFKVQTEPDKEVIAPIKSVGTQANNPDEIKKILREHVPQFRYCYQSELDVSKKKDGFQGAMMFRFFIGSEGKVDRSEITSKELTSDKLVACMKNVLHGIQFPLPYHGRTIEINQSMNLYPTKK